MTIEEMHKLFRTLGQQMGMQLIRAILPESIDDYLNDSIIELTRNIIISNVQTVYKDKVTTQNNSISGLNSIGTLIKQFEFQPIPENNKIDLKSEIEDCMFYTSFVTTYGTISYSARIIENDKVHSVLNDYCNKASKEYPVITYIGDDVFKLYCGDTSPESLLINYIKIPNTVSLNKNVSCDLPEHLHHQVVENAVNKFFQSVGSTTQNVN